MFFLALRRPAVRLSRFWFGAVRRVLLKPADRAGTESRRSASGS